MQAKTVNTATEEGRGKYRRVVRGLLSWGAVVILVFLALVVVCDWWIVSSTRDRVYTDIRILPENDVALVLGTTRWVATGKENQYFTYRMEAAAQLYHHGKVKYLLLSGDNHTEHYNEPVTMQKALRNLGVPDSVMTLDYAGFRTLDSIIRAKKVFGLSQVTIVSQAFHAPRALFIADNSDLRAIGFAAQPVQTTSSAYIDLRERLARFLAVVDVHILDKQPRFLGDPIPVPQTQSDSLSS